MFDPVFSYVRKCWLPMAALLVFGAQPIQAQWGDLDFRFRGGVALPTGEFSDFFSVGPSAGLDILYPLRDRVSLLVDLDLEQVNHGTVTYAPDTRMLRYQLGAEADVLRARDDHLRLAAYAGAGATSFRSKTFATQTTPSGTERFSQTYFTGTGGLRLGLDPGGALTWWVSGEYNWSPTDEADLETLRLAAPYEVDPFGSATSLGLSLGLTIRP